MREYELFYLVGESKEAELDAIKTEVEKMFVEEGATFLSVETTDKRKLAYEVNGEVRGFYIARRFTLPDSSDLTSAEFEKAMQTTDAITRLNRKLALSKNVLRVLILRAEDLPELKQIERTEYTKRETRGRGVRPSSAPRPFVGKDTPLPNVDKEAPVVSKEVIDKKLEEVLDI